MKTVMTHASTLFAALALTIAVAGGAAAESQSKTVGAPQSKGYMVNFCLKTGGSCGQATADMYCKAIGYASATAFSKGWSKRATIMLGSKEICKPVFGSVAGQKCEALQNVTCTRQVFKKQPGLTPEMPGAGG